MSKRKLKAGTHVEFLFAGNVMEGVITEVYMDDSYSTSSKWYKVLHKDGTIYPLRVEDLSIKVL